MFNIISIGAQNCLTLQELIFHIYSVLQTRIAYLGVGRTRGSRAFEMSYLTNQTATYHAVGRQTYILVDTMSPTQLINQVAPRNAMDPRMLISKCFPSILSPAVWGPSDTFDCFG